MKASLQKLLGCFALRVHGEDQGYGTPYSWCCLVTPDGNTAEISMTLRSPSAEERISAEEVLRNNGFTHVRWERIKEGKIRITREFSLWR